MWTQHGLTGFTIWFVLMTTGLSSKCVWLMKDQEFVRFIGGIMLDRLPSSIVKSCEIHIISEVWIGGLGGFLKWESPQIMHFYGGPINIHSPLTNQLLTISQRIFQHQLLGSWRCAPEMNGSILWPCCTSCRGPHQKDGWNMLKPTESWDVEYCLLMFTIYQLVISQPFCGYGVPSSKILRFACAGRGVLLLSISIPTWKVKNKTQGPPHSTGQPRLLCLKTLKLFPTCQVPLMPADALILSDL